MQHTTICNDQFSITNDRQLFSEQHERTWTTQCPLSIAGWLSCLYTQVSTPLVRSHLVLKMEESLISYDHRGTVFKNYGHVWTCCDAAFVSCVIQLCKVQGIYTLNTSTDVSLQTPTQTYTNLFTEILWTSRTCI
jgi:hypothetical protein